MNKRSMAALFLLLTGCSNTMSAKQTEFEWLATESAPAHYPMEVIDGNLFFKGQESGLYIPSGGTLTAGWGTGISNHVVGDKLKPLPDRLNIRFFSLGENQFYEGKFDLPYERILELFREGVAEDKNNPVFRSIMVGIAPGGAVAVWLKGRERYVEVFFGQAEKIKMDPSSAWGMPFNTLTPDEFVRKNIESVLTPEEVSSLDKNGIPFGLWSRYRNKYMWSPTFNAPVNKDKLNIKFLNGESDMYYVFEGTPSPLPRQFAFKAKVGEKELYYINHFDEFELMDAFEKLGANGEKVYLDFDLRVPRPATKVRVYNEKESIELKKTVTEDW